MESIQNANQFFQQQVPPQQQFNILENQNLPPLQEDDKEYQSTLQMTMTRQKENRRVELRKSTLRDLLNKNRFGNKQLKSFISCQESEEYQRKIQLQNDQILDNIYTLLIADTHDSLQIQSEMQNYKNFINEEDPALISNYKNGSNLTERLGLFIELSCEADLDRILDDNLLDLLEISLYILHNLVYEPKYAQIMVEYVDELVLLIEKCNSIYTKALALNVLVNMIISEEKMDKIQPFTPKFSEKNIELILLNKILPQITDYKGDGQIHKLVLKELSNGMLRFIYNYVESGQQINSLSNIKILVEILCKMDNLKDPFLLDKDCKEEVVACLGVLLQQLDKFEIVYLYPTIEDFLIFHLDFVVNSPIFKKQYQGQQKFNIIKDTCKIFQILANSNERYANEMPESGIFDFLKLIFGETRDSQKFSKNLQPIANTKCIQAGLELLSSILQSGSQVVSQRVFSTPELGHQQYLIKKLFEYIEHDNSDIQFYSLQCFSGCLKNLDLEQSIILANKGLMIQLCSFLEPGKPANQIYAALVSLELLFYLEEIHTESKLQEEEHQYVVKFDEQQGFQLLHILQQGDYGEKVNNYVTKIIDNYDINSFL